MMTVDETIKLIRARANGTGWGLYLEPQECAALLLRIEQGDRAREALRRLQEDYHSYGVSRELCSAVRMELNVYLGEDMP